MTLDDIYTPLEEARVELDKRWSDKELKKESERFIGNTKFLPEYFFEKPHALFIEDVASPNLLTYTFREMASKIDLEPLHLEYLEDIFVTRNLDKSALGKMRFYHGKNDKGEMITSVERVMDMTGREERKKFSEIRTIWGEKLTDFHHRIFFSCFPKGKVFDGSDWYKENGKLAVNYYDNIFSMCISHCILFEAFFYDGYEKGFTNDIVIPTFMDIEKRTGLRPLIVKLIPMQHYPREFNEKYWWCYPEYIKMNMRK